MTFGVCKAPLLDWLNTLGRNRIIGIAPNAKSVESSFCGSFKKKCTIKYPMPIIITERGTLLMRQLKMFFSITHLNF